MSARFDIYGDIHQYALMQRLRAENQHLREEVAKFGVDPDIIVRGMNKLRRLKRRHAKAS